MRWLKQRWCLNLIATASPIESGAWLSDDGPLLVLSSQMGHHPKPLTEIDALQTGPAKLRRAAAKASHRLAGRALDCGRGPSVNFRIAGWVHSDPDVEPAVGSAEWLLRETRDEPL